MDERSFREVLDRIVQAFKDMCAQISDLAKQFTNMFEVESEIWKLHKCRVCGRTFYTSVDAQKCVERHRARDARAAFRGSSKVAMKYCGKHVVPRNREATMRRTEMRREIMKHEK